MKTLGLLGGMSWESTVTYYQIINKTVKKELGGLHSAKILLYSVDFSEIEEYQSKNEWVKSAEILGAAALNLQKAGADLIVICTNTMHKVAPQIQEKITVPIIHIADATADTLLNAGINKAALLGTKYTMTQDFYKDKLIARDIDVLIPKEQDIEKVNRIIYDELCCGIISSDSRKEFVDIIKELKSRGAQAVILGCTEIGLLIHQEDSPLPMFDTTQIHAIKAALTALC